MEISNKKINFLGDSITQGVGVSARENKYVEVFARKFSPAVVRNYGKIQPLTIRDLIWIFALAYAKWTQMLIS